MAAGCVSFISLGEILAYLCIQITIIYRNQHVTHVCTLYCLLQQALARRRLARRFGGEEPAEAEQVSQVLMDDNLMELTKGRPFPLKHRAKVRTCWQVEVVWNVSHMMILQSKRVVVVRQRYGDCRVMKIDCKYLMAVYSLACLLVCLFSIVVYYWECMYVLRWRRKDDESDRGDDHIHSFLAPLLCLCAFSVGQRDIA